MARENANHAFFGTSALLFAASAVVTIVWCKRMSEMGAMPMPGGWSMSMAWMRMPGQSWSGAAASFLGMWLVMMAAMMLPSLVPALWRFRRAHDGVKGGRLDLLTAAAGAAYFLVWMALGLAIFPLGVALADAEMQSTMLSQAVPLAAGATVLIAGGLQFTAWKARSLTCCRATTEFAGPAELSAALRYGLACGVYCVACCAPLTAVLLAAGVMDLRAMALVTAAITAERLAGPRVARAIGGVLILAGLYMLAQASGLL